MPTGSPRHSITALVPTYNSASTIRECLESVRWVDTIFIVDSFSTDQTLPICREYTDHIVQHPYVNAAAQKNWAMTQITSDWTLQIDSDECIEPALGDEILDRLGQREPFDGYRVRIKNLVWGKWVRCCDLYPCAQVRLFRTSLGRWSDREVHAWLQGVARVADLEGHIVHRDLEDLSAELNQFARQVVVWEANELVKRGRRWRWWDVTLRPLAIFLLFFFGKGGCLEGFRGFYLSVYRGYYSFMTYARLYEIEVGRGLHL